MHLSKASQASDREAQQNIRENQGANRPLGKECERASGGMGSTSVDRVLSNQQIEAENNSQMAPRTSLENQGEFCRYNTGDVLELGLSEVLLSKPSQSRAVFYHSCYCYLASSRLINVFWTGSCPWRHRA
jgi:hypothetical protein